MQNSQRVFVFIRAINVGSLRLTNDRLMEPFAGLGFADVAAYQAAGNITFRCDDPTAVKPDLLEAELGRVYGFDPVIFVRTPDEMRKIVTAQPFSPDDIARTQGRIQVSFLRKVPNDSMIGEVFDLAPAGDMVAFFERHWFWLPATGVSDSQLPVKSVEEIVGPITMRTLGTVRRMFDKFGNRN